MTRPTSYILHLSCSFSTSILKTDNALFRMTTEPASEPSSRYLIPKSQPISLLQNDTARLYRHVHPALVLSLLYLSFFHLVSDPVTTLAKAIPPIAILQLLYCLTCLPPSTTSPSSSVSGTSTQSTSTGSGSTAGTPKTPKRKRVQFVKPPPTAWSKFIVSLLPSAPIRRRETVTDRSYRSLFPPKSLHYKKPGQRG